MRTSFTISAVGHTAVLLWSVLTFAAKPYQAASTESLPIDIISATEFSQMMAGSRSGQKSETPKPLVETIGEERRVDDATAKVVEKKKEVKAATDAPPMPEPKPPDSKPQAAPQATKDVKPDPIAEVLKKDAAKKLEPKKAETKTPMPPKKPARQAPKFDPRQVAALLDKRDPQRLAAAGETINSDVSLGLSSGQSAKLSQSELDALRARLAQLWNPPAGAKNPEELVVQVRVKFKPDGTLASPPTVLTSGYSPLFVAARDSAVRAIFRGQPFNMLRPEHYDQWKDVEITFDPRDMIRG